MAEGPTRAHCLFLCGLGAKNGFYVYSDGGEKQVNNIIWPMYIIWNSNFSVCQ